MTDLDYYKHINHLVENNQHAELHEFYQQDSRRLALKHGHDSDEVFHEKMKLMTLTVNALKLHEQQTYQFLITKVGFHSDDYRSILKLTVRKNEPELFLETIRVFSNSFKRDDFQAEINSIFSYALGYPDFALEKGLAPFMEEKQTFYIGGGTCYIHPLTPLLKQFIDYSNVENMEIRKKHIQTFYKTAQSLYPNTLKHEIEDCIASILKDTPVALEIHKDILWFFAATPVLNQNSPYEGNYTLAKSIQSTKNSDFNDLLIDCRQYLRENDPDFKKRSSLWFTPTNFSRVKLQYKLEDMPVKDVVSAVPAKRKKI